jgi:Ca2+-binding RTX toxin-like protein
MQRPADRQEMNEDGTPRRKYELDDADESRLWFRTSLGMVLTSAVILAKNLMFGPKPQQYADGGMTDFADRTQHIQDADTAPTVTFDNASNSATDTADDLIKTFKNSLVPAASRGDWASVANDSAVKLAAIPRGQTNDNVPLYGAAPGYSVTLPQAESGSPYASHMGRAIDTGGALSDVLRPAAQSDDSTNTPPTKPPVAPPVADKDRAANRLPVSSGALNLGSLLVNSTFILALNELLRNASDPDGDALTVTNFRASSGTAIVGTDGFFRFTPALDDTSNVTFTFAVSDGEGSIQQVAYLDLLPTEAKSQDGTPQNDVLIGTPQDDIINALGGDDTIIGREGDDIIYAGDGNDRIIAGDGNDIVYAGAGNDIVYAGAGNDVVFGETGNDIIFGEAGRDVLNGGSGSDTISGGEDDDTVNGEDGDDVLLGDGGNDVLVGEFGNDRADGGTGNDTLLLGAGDDIGMGNDGNDGFIAGTGQSVQAALSNSAGEADSTTTLLPGPAAQIHTLSFGSDNTVVCDDTSLATTGSSLQRAVTIAGSDDADTFTIFSAAEASAAGITDIAAGAEIIVTRNGTDNRSVVAELADIGALNIDTADGDDHITFIGDFGATELFIVDGGGSDTIDVAQFTSVLDVSFYSGGDDQIVGDIGHINLIGIDDGNDSYDGSGGNDTYDMSSAVFNANVNLATGTANSEDTGHDTLLNIENVTTGSGNDQIVGDDNDNQFVTNSGDDEISAGAGNDSIRSGDGNDVFVAGSGPTHSSDGDDYYDGGNGIDTYDTSSISTAVTIDLDAGAATGSEIGLDYLTNVENVITGSADDVVIGNDGANIVETGAGNDTFVAVAGAEGESDGDDRYDGGDGTDTYDTSDIATSVVIDLAAEEAFGERIGNDVLNHVENVITGSDADTVIGSDTTNVIQTGGGDDIVHAGDGDDIIRAGGVNSPEADYDGNDTFNGGQGSDTYDISSFLADVVVDLNNGTAVSDDIGADTLHDIENVYCGDGDDTIYANEEANSFSGGQGDDLFVFNSIASIGSGRGSRDRVLDFEVGDRINLDDIVNEFEDAGSQSGSGSGSRAAFDVSFIGADQAFTRPGELRLRYDDFDGERGNVLLEGNTDYDDRAEFQLEFLGDLDDLSSILAQSFLNQSGSSQH